MSDTVENTTTNNQETLENKEQKQVSHITGIFQISGVKGKNSIVINHVKNVNLTNSQYIEDKKEDTFPLLRNVTGELYRCNITHTYLQSTKKLPLYYVVVRYSSKMSITQLFKLVLYFRIDDDIESSNQLLGDELNGKYTLEMDIGENSQEIDSDFGEYQGNKKTKQKLLHITKQEQIIDIVKGMMIKADEEKVKEMGDPYSNLEPPKVTISLRDV